MRAITIWLQHKHTNEIFQGIVFSDKKKKNADDTMRQLVNGLLGFRP